MIEMRLVPDENTEEERVSRGTLVDECVRRGLLVPCSGCGTANASVYSNLALRCALNGALTIDANPTHPCGTFQKVMADSRLDGLLRAVESA